MREKPDFILYAGDDLARFQEEGINHFSHPAKYTTQKSVLAIAGNDDFAEVKFVLRADGVHDLYNSPFIFGDFAFVGLEGSTSGPGLPKHSEEHVKAHLEKQRVNCNGKDIVVLSHTPPYGTLDMGIRFADPQDGANHIGSKALRAFTEEEQPVLVICGHCHSQGRMTANLGATEIVNIASHDLPGSTGNFALVEITEARNVQVEFSGTEDLTPPNSLLNVHGVGPSISEALAQAGITIVDQLIEAPDLYRIADSSGVPLATLSRIKAKSVAFKEGKPFKLKDVQPV